MQERKEQTNIWSFNRNMSRNEMYQKKEKFRWSKNIFVSHELIDHDLSSHLSERYIFEKCSLAIDWVE